MIYKVPGFIIQLLTYISGSRGAITEGRTGPKRGVTIHDIYKLRVHVGSRARSSHPGRPYALLDAQTDRFHHSDRETRKGALIQKMRRGLGRGERQVLAIGGAVFNQLSEELGSIGVHLTKRCQDEGGERDPLGRAR